MWIEEEHHIRASRRRILVGMDESHLFVCPLKEGGSSVAEAHRKLAPDNVHRARHSLKVRRQGEWFFIPVKQAAVAARIEEELQAGRYSTHAALTAGGRPHRADRLLRVGEEMYVLGAIRHSDHRVVNLKSWHKMERNTENIEVRPTGMSWVD